MLRFTWHVGVFLLFHNGGDLVASPLPLQNVRQLEVKQFAKACIFQQELRTID